MRNCPAFFRSTRKSTTVFASSLGHVGDVLDLRLALRLQIERRRAERIGPGLVVGDLAARLVALEEDFPGDIVRAVGIGADRIGEIAKAVGIADDRHPVLLAVLAHDDLRVLPLVGRPVPQRQLGMLLVDDEIHALRAEDVLGAGFEDEDVDLVAELRAGDVAHEDADRIVGAGELHLDADGIGHVRPVLQLRRRHAVAAHHVGRHGRGDAADERGKGRSAADRRHALQHVAARQLQLRGRRKPVLHLSLSPVSHQSQRGSTTQSSARHATASKRSDDAARSQFRSLIRPIGVSAVWSMYLPR